VPPRLAPPSLNAPENIILILWNLDIASSPSTKLHDGKPLGGKGCLIQSVIDKLKHYGLAIRRNVKNLETMKKAVWAIYFQKLSTNEKDQHGLCSSGDANWCKFKKSACSGVAYEHKYSLPPTVMNAIKPLLRGCARVDLMKRCLHGKSQNSNESLNSVIWKGYTKLLL